jgi:hypothetical protein
VSFGPLPGVRSPDDLRKPQSTGCSGLYALDVPRFEYDEEASAAEHMDVVHEVLESKPVSVTRWVEAMRRLNAIRDPLARQILALHRECGSGTGVCDSVDGELLAIADRSGWGCETTEVIALHFGVDYPEPSAR